MDPMGYPIDVGLNTHTHTARPPSRLLSKPSTPCFLFLSDTKLKIEYVYTQISHSSTDTFLFLNHDMLKCCLFVCLWSESEDDFNGIPAIFWLYRLVPLQLMQLTTQKICIARHGKASITGLLNVSVQPLNVCTPKTILISPKNDWWSKLFKLGYLF